eukprot:2265118-Rhodomonas_salina.2
MVPEEASVALEPVPRDLPRNRHIILPITLSPPTFSPHPSSLTTHPSQHTKQQNVREQDRERGARKDDRGARRRGGGEGRGAGLWGSGRGRRWWCTAWSRAQSRGSSPPCARPLLSGRYPLCTPVPVLVSTSYGHRPLSPYKRGRGEGRGVPTHMQRVQCGCGQSPSLPHTQAHTRTVSNTQIDRHGTISSLPPSLPPSLLPSLLKFLSSASRGDGT